MSVNIAVEVSVEEKGKRTPKWDIDSDLNGEVSLADFLAFTKLSLIEISNEVLQEEISKGFDKDHLTVVDGRKGKPLQAVSPLGQVEFLSRADIAELVEETYDGLMERSPVDTGLYKESHYVFLNGYLVARDKTSLTAWLNSNPDVREKDIIRFVNVMPYSRRLERLGVTNQRSRARTQKSRDKRGRSGFGGRILAPNGTYYLTYRSISRKYKGNARIRFEVVPLSRFNLTSLPRTTKRGQNLRWTFRATGRPYVFPSIVINLGQGGFY